MGAALLAGGAGFLWNRTSRWSAAAIAAYYLLAVVILMNGSNWIVQPAVYGEYEGICIQLAIALAALVAWANPAGKDSAFNARLVRGCQIVFGLCALVFGGAHFVYLNMTQPLVPKWLPPSQIFWAYATGLAQMAGGAAIMTGIQGRLAARLLTVMYALFQGLIHLPMLIADPSNHYIWSENATNLALTGAAWIIADTMATKSATLQEPSE
ncbi:MAG: hypothetical protein ACXU8O_05035 [Asticcacaulis sp.]